MLKSSIEGSAWVVGEMPVSRIYSYFDVEEKDLVVLDGYPQSRVIAFESYPHKRAMISTITHDPYGESHTRSKILGRDGL